MSFIMVDDIGRDYGASAEESVKEELEMTARDNKELERKVR